MKGIRDPNKKSYTFSPKVMCFLKRRLQYSKEVEKMNSKKYAGGDITKLKKKIEEEYENINTEKIRFLDQHIFRSMANLVFFFEYLVKHSELRELFEDDIKELFGYVGNYQYDKGKPGYQNIMVRFMESLLKFDIQKEDNSNDFRLGLIGDIQLIIHLAISYLASKEFYKDDRGVYEKIYAAMDDAKLWTTIYNKNYKKSEQAKIDRRKIPSRPVSF